MRDMTSREILDAFAPGLEEATRPFYPQSDKADVEKPPLRRVSELAEDGQGFDRAS